MRWECLEKIMAEKNDQELCVKKTLKLLDIATLNINAWLELLKRLDDHELPKR